MSRKIVANVSASRAELAAAWKAKRNARLEAIRTGGPAVDPILQGWADLGVHGNDTIAGLRSAISTLLSESAPSQEDLETLKRSLDGAPSPELPSSLKAALETVTAERLIAHLGELLQAGMPWITDLGRRRVQLLSFAHPVVGTVKLPGEDILDGPAAWRVYLAALGHPSRVSDVEILAVVPSVSLPVVDDLIDLGLLSAADLPWRHRESEEDRRYLIARLAPEQISRSEATALGWTDLERRYRFLDGEHLEDGDDLYSLLSAFWRGEQDISLRTRLSPRARDLFDEIVRGAQTGFWPTHVLADQGLWGLLSALWIPGELINPKVSEYHAWRALSNSHRWILIGWHAKARSQVQQLLDAARAPGRHDGRFLPAAIRAEIHTMAAYLAQETNELDFAIQLLHQVESIHPGVRANLERLKKRRATTINDRDHWENPYLVLGVPHGDSGWEEQWRFFFKERNRDLDRLTEINSAKQRIISAERHGTDDFYVLPLDEKVMSFPTRRSAALLPDLEPYSRQILPAQALDLAELRAEAARTLLSDFSFSNPHEKEKSIGQQQ